MRRDGCAKNKRAYRTTWPRSQCASYLRHANQRRISIAFRLVITISVQWSRRFVACFGDCSQRPQKHSRVLVCLRRYAGKMWWMCQFSTRVVGGRTMIWMWSLRDVHGERMTGSSSGSNDSGSRRCVSEISLETFHSSRGAGIFSNPGWFFFLLECNLGSSILVSWSEIRTEKAWFLREVYATLHHV